MFFDKQTNKTFTATTKWSEFQQMFWHNIAESYSHMTQHTNWPVIKRDSAKTEGQLFVKLYILLQRDMNLTEQNDGSDSFCWKC